MGFFSSFIGNNTNSVNVSSGTVTINGKTIHTGGGSISVINGKVYVDGKEYEDKEIENSKIINIEIHGDCENVSCNGNVTVTGNTGKINAGNSVNVKGIVKGNVDAGTDVEIDGDVDGNVDAGTSVKVNGNVSGDVDAGTSVKVGSNR